MYMSTLHTRSILVLTELSQQILLQILLAVIITTNMIVLIISKFNQLSAKLLV